MELKEFVKGTIENIKDAVAELQAENETSARINPLGVNKSDHILVHSGAEKVGLRVVDVEFNVCLEEIEVDGGTKSIGVFFKDSGIGASKKKENNTASYTSVKFSIPMTLPIKP